MLETAKRCFTSASHCEGDGDEEEWLIHYMLGKIAEKQKQPPAISFLHYKQAGHFLHEEAARYPKKIHYHNPPELAMEALEVKRGDKLLSGLCVCACVYWLGLFLKADCH